MKVKPLGSPSAGLELEILVIGRGGNAYLRCAVLDGGEEVYLFSEISGKRISRDFIKMGKQLSPGEKAE